MREITLLEKEPDERVELLQEDQYYNYIRMSSRLFALAKQLGPVNLPYERLGERALPPWVLTAGGLEELRSICARHHPAFERK